MISGYWADVLSQTGINAIVAIGMYLMMMTRQLSMAQAAFMAIGAYAAAVLTTNFGVPFIIAIMVGGLAAGIVSSLLALVIARLRMWIFAVATLGFGQVMVTVFLNTPYLGGALGFNGIPRVTQLWIVALILATLLVLFARFEHSSLYYAFLSTGDDEMAAEATGVNTTMMRLVAFAMGSFIAGIGGALYAHSLGVMQASQADFSHSMIFLIFVIVGGERSFWGAIVGAAILTILPELLRFSVYERYVLFGAILVLVMVLRPNGLLTRHRLGEGRWLTRLSRAVRRRPGFAG